MIGLLSDIVEWKNEITDEPELIIIEFVTFKVDYFPWRKGDEVHVLQLADKEDGVWLEEVDGEKVIQSTRVKLVSMSEAAAHVH